MMVARSFVYALTNKGTVFYVGQTDDIYTRFSAHFYDAPCRFYITQMLENNEIPNLLILAMYGGEYSRHICPIERAFIKYFASINHKLCNTEFNNTDNIIKIEKVNKPVPKIKRGLRNTIVKNAIEKYYKDNNLS